MTRAIISFWLFVFSILTISAQENFLLINNATNESVVAIGEQLDTRISPCSTFKIALSLIGFDAHILHNENAPIWQFQEGFPDFLETWKTSQTPQTWMKHSCVWYSQLLTQQLGMHAMCNYMHLFNYGNQDFSGGLTKAWLSSSLKITPREQAQFIQQLVSETLPISKHAIAMTRSILYIEQLNNEGKLFGKTGWGRAFDQEIGWFVGWVEKDTKKFPFVYLNIEDKIQLNQRIPRTKQLLAEYLSQLN